MTRDEVIERVRPHAGSLREDGIAGLWLFGSAARNTAGPDSDVDFLCDLDLSRGMDLIDFINVKLRLGDIVGARTDLVERSRLRPRIRASAESDMVRIF